MPAIDVRDCNIVTAMPGKPAAQAGVDVPAGVDMRRNP